MVVFEAVVIALGLIGLMVINDYRAGLLTIPPTVKDIAGFALGFVLWFSVVLGLFGWVLFIEYIVEYKQNDRNGDNNSVRNGDLPNFDDNLASCGTDLASLRSQENGGAG